MGEMKFPVRWSRKRGDRLIYLTPKGKRKEFIYGLQTWYGHDVPRRVVESWRKYGKRWTRYRLPTIGEIFTKTYKMRARELRAAFSDDNPLLQTLKKYSSLSNISGGRTIIEPIRIK